MTTVELKRTGQKMPLVGLGIWKIGNAECANVVYNAIKIGYRLIDGAADYGNEKEAGEGVRRAIDEGIIKREDIFITTKIWNTNHSFDHVKAACKKQLEDWGVGYFDLLLVHFPVSLQYVDPGHRYPPAWWGDDGKTVTLQNTPMQETWRAMEELVDAGAAKSIGISNCAGSMLIDILRYARIPPNVVQIELHPYLTQDHYIALTNTLGIAVTGYSSFGPQGYYELGFKGATSFFENEKVLSIASSHKRSPAQILLRWATQRNIAVIPKSNTEDRLKENLDCTSFDLTESDFKELNSLNINLRLNNPRDIDPRLAIFA